MKHSFYDVKTKKKVQAEVTKAVKFGKGTRTRYAFKALEGRPQSDRFRQQGRLGQVQKVI